jgi:hypothetical protein
MDVDPRRYIASEMKDDRDQRLVGEALERVCRSWDVYADRLGLGPRATLDVMLNFDLAFFAVVADRRALQIEWILEGCQQQHDLEGGPTLEAGIVAVVTPDGIAAFWRDLTPGLTDEAGVMRAT